MKQVNVLYSGRVQGVGFRFTAVELAHNLGVKGRVSNLDDGRVRVVALAGEEALKQFLEKIHQHFSRYISNVDIEWQDPQEVFQDFSIEF